MRFATQAASTAGVMYGQRCLAIQRLFLSSRSAKHVNPQKNNRGGRDIGSDYKFVRTAFNTGVDSGMPSDDGLPESGGLPV